MYLNKYETLQNLKVSYANLLRLYLLRIDGQCFLLIDKSTQIVVCCGTAEDVEEYLEELERD